MKISLLVAASAGLLSFLSPCVLPVVPSYLAFVAGASLSDLRRPGRAARRGLVIERVMTDKPSLKTVVAITNPA
jgi:cytochrome c-type biogenesis protein